MDFPTGRLVESYVNPVIILWESSYIDYYTGSHADGYMKLTGLL
jgi:hypothetical protein